MAKDKEEVLAEIRGSFAQGIEHYNSGNLAEAETEFVKTLRPLLSKPDMKAIHPENIEGVKIELLRSMYHLGEIYLRGVEILKAKYGECTDHHSKAAAIFQYCAGFAAKYEATIEVKGRVADSDYFLRKAYDVEREFLVQVSGAEVGASDADESKEAYYEDYKQRVENYKSDLANIRAATKEMLNDISDLGVEQIADRAASVEDIYRTSSQFFVDHQPEPMSLSADSATTTAEGRTGNGLIQRLLSECHDQLGNPPQGCGYSIVGLGSLALGTMTPWSDLEFAVLVNEDRENYREYFRNLTQLLHIKIINLGETMLRSVGIESLNNFRTANEADDWFWDDVIESGFSFDGAAWHACKHPLGRQGDYQAARKEKNEHGVEVTITESKPDYELILTPQQLAAWQFAPEEQATEGERAEEPIDESRPTFATDRHLVQSLRSMALIDGSQVLLDEYRDHFRTYSPPEGTSNELQEHALIILKENVDEFSLKLGDEEEGKLIDIKKDIYRLGDRVVTMLADYYGIAAEPGHPNITVWQSVDLMQLHRKLSPEGAQHLKEALGIATELRLSTYANNESQGEMMSSYVPAVEHLTEEEKHQLLEKTFHIKDIGILHRFYHVMLRMQVVIQGFCDQDWHDRAEIVLGNDDLHGDSNYNKGMVHARFLEYDKAMLHLEAAKEEQLGNLQILLNLYFLYSKTGIIDKSIDIMQEIQLLARTQNQDNPNHPDLAMSHNNLGNAYLDKGEYDAAIQKYKTALKIYEIAFVLTPNHPFIANSHHNLGNAYLAKGEYDAAIEEYKIALEVYEAEYEAMPNHPSIANNHNSLGVAYEHKSEYDAATREYKTALKIYEIAFASTPNHPYIANSHHNLGAVHARKGEYDAAIQKYKIALEIYEKAYASTPNHPYIINSHNNLGLAYADKGDYDAAIVEHEIALEMCEQTFASTPNHFAIATSHSSLGNAYLAKSEYDAAIVEHKKALEIYEIAYASTPNHSSIAISHNNLGTAYKHKGEYDAAVAEHKIALEMFKLLHVSTPNHPNIADGHNNLGAAYTDIGDYDAAIMEYKTSLEIKLVCYASTPNHPAIVKSYNNLGLAYFCKGEYQKALSCVKKGDVYDNALVQLGNQALLANNQDQAREYYKRVDPELAQIEFDSERFIQLQFQTMSVAYKSKALSASISCQLVLVKIDPELKYGNHYHNLACCYAIQGNINEANTAFLLGLERSEASCELHAEYAQFLILNHDNPILSDAIQTISEHLYSVIASESVVGLFYGRLEVGGVCEVLSNLIRQTNADVVVEPKVLAYYLLITHPEYIIEGPEAVGRLLETFRELAIELSDEISKTLFANAEALVASGQVVEVAEDQEGIFTADHVEQPQPSAEQTTQATLSGEAENVGEYPTS